MSPRSSFPTLVVVVLGLLAPLFGASCREAEEGDDPAATPGPDETSVPTADAAPSSDSGVGSSGPKIPPFPVAPKEIRDACLRKSTVAVNEFLTSDPAQREAQRSYIERACIVDAVAPGSTITATDIDSCTAALDGRDPCLQHPPVACAPRAGTLALGAKCVSGHQCGSGACSTRGPSCGVCVAAKSAGESCVERDCAPGLVCRPVTKPPWTCSSPTCAPGSARCEVPERESDLFAASAQRGLIGDSCVTDYGCKRFLHCVDGKCEGGKVGSSCGPTSVTLCEPGLSCHAVTKTCVEGTVDPGESCDSAHPCRAGLFCATSLARPVCKSLAGLGEPCGSAADGAECAPGPRGEEVGCHYATHLCTVAIARLETEAACRAASTPACAPCAVTEINGGCGSGTGAYGTLRPGDVTCDKAAACEITQCLPRAPCTGKCQPSDPYWCSRQ